MRLILKQIVLLSLKLLFISMIMSYNPYSLENKIILVTGASSGIGRSTAIECSKLGAHVIITARNEDRLKETLSMSLTYKDSYTRHAVGPMPSLRHSSYQY